MPQFGQVDAATLAPPAPAGSPPPLPWEIRGALVQQVTFESTVPDTLAVLPGLLARPAPPYTRIRIVDHPDSPVGPYREALLLVSCRYLMLPRQYVAASIVTTAEAQAGNAQRGYASALGEVALTQTADGFVGSLADGSGLSIEVASPAAVETAPAVIRYDPDVVVLPDDGQPTVFTVSAEPTAVESAWLAVGTSVTYSGGDRDNVWRRLRSRNPITCAIARQDMPYPSPVAVKRPG